MRSTVKKYTSMVNVPSTGCDNNYLWPAAQLNVASVLAASVGTFFVIVHYRCLFLSIWIASSKNMDGDLGGFSGTHKDGGDADQGVTCITPQSDIPDSPGWEPGRFHFNSTGAYVVLEKK